MGRLEARLAALAGTNEKALALFITAGYPELHSTVGLARMLEEGGADILEIGMPFSDPLADGPVIQESSTVALRNGVHLQSILEDVARIRSSSDIPVVLMGYLNPILSFGAEELFSIAGKVGVDGIILPELPLEEAGRYARLCRTNGLSQILLVTPTSTPERISAIDDASSGFVYCVSTTGVTGSAATKTPVDYLMNVRRLVRKNPLLVGFGISTPEAAREKAKTADGVIIGSALIKRLKESPAPEELREWVRGFKKALRDSAVNVES